jgi:hypothetical protein
MDTTTVDLRIGGDHFHTEQDPNTGCRVYFVNGLAVTVTDYLARMQHYREIELQRLFGRSHPHPSAIGSQWPDGLRGHR